MDAINMLHARAAQNFDGGVGVDRLASPSPAPALILVPGYRLFRVGGVVLAALVGGPAAGCALMAVNYGRLGERGKAWMTMLVGVVVTGLAVGLGFLMPSGGSYTVALGLLFGMRVACTKMQGQAIEVHRQRGGRLASNWVSLAVGVVFAALLFGGIYAAVSADESRTKVVIGSRDEVIYTGTATRAEAQALGEALKSLGYFKDRGTSVFLDKGAAGRTISLVMHEGAWDEPGKLDAAEELVRDVASAVGGFPVHVKLVNASAEVKREGLVGRVKVGDKDEIFYFDDATETQARALGGKLRAIGYLGDRGADVLLWKRGAATALGFVVSDGYWEDAAHVAGFASVARGAMPAAGGLPVTLRLLNLGMEVKREQLVQ